MGYTRREVLSATSVAAVSPVFSFESLLQWITDAKVREANPDGQTDVIKAYPMTACLIWARRLSSQTRNTQ